MQIMDKIYCYFAYAHDLGFALNDEEINDIERAVQLQDADQMADVALSKVKGLLTVKKAKVLNTEYGERIHEAILSRKIKFCTSTKISVRDEEEFKVQRDVVGSLLRQFTSFQVMMQEHLIRSKETHVS